MITEDTLDKLNVYITENGVDAGKLQELRAHLGDIHLTHCMDDDVCGPKPVREYDTYNVYLVDSSDHCISFTPSMETATGLVIAEVEPEDE